MKIYYAIAALCALFMFGCAASQPAVSPTETLKIFLEASKKKDIAAVKKVLSKSTLDAVEKSAKMQNTTVDEILLKDDGTPPAKSPETRNEKINGDTATLEVKNSVTGEFDSMPFVKEDGAWKLAVDKFMETMIQKQAGQTKMPAPLPSNPAKSDDDKKPTTPEANLSSPDDSGK